MIWIIYVISNILCLFLVSNFVKLINLQDPIIKNRSSHTSTSYLGGGLYLILSFLLLIFLFELSDELKMIIYFSFCFSLIGLFDDLLNLNFKSKLILQLIISSIIIYKNNYYFTSLDLGFMDIHIGNLGLILTVLAVLLVINSLNYFDGLDGLCAFLIISMIILINLLFEPKINLTFYVVIIIPLTGFLLSNFQIIKINKMFLGDGGNYILSFLVSIIYLNEAKLNYLSSLNFQIMGLWFFGLLFFEFVSISFIRIKENKSIFQPGKDHLHHLLNKNLDSHFKTSLTISILYIFISIIGYLITIKFENFSILIFLTLFICYLKWRVKLHDKHTY